jgi:hypothetical protein
VPGHHVLMGMSRMPRVMRWVAAGVIIIISISAGLMCGSLLAQDTPPVSVSPSTATIMVGDTRSFRAVDKNGRMLHDALDRFGARCGEPRARR